MQGLKVQCPNCKRRDFVTTDKYDPDVQPNGSMVKCLLPYQSDWLCSSTTLASEMTCPECLAPLVVAGSLNVVYPARECGGLFTDETVLSPEVNEAINYIEPPPGATEQAVDEVKKKFLCDVCGKECKSAIGLQGHIKTHNKTGRK